MVLEQEIKLSVLGCELDLNTIAFRGYQQSEIKRERLISTYFDTPGLTLIKHGVGLRMRFDGNQWCQTVKETGHVKNGLHQRQEWEQVLPTKDFDLESLKATPLKRLIENKAIWPKVSSVFTTDFIRQIIVLTIQDHTEIEFAYDQGTIYGENKVSTIHEIELELKAGDLNQLQLLATHLKSILAIQVNDISKAQQGYALLSTNVQL
jgi:triphosphatase